MYINQFTVVPVDKLVVLIQHQCENAGHPRAEIKAGRPNGDDDLAGYVFAAVVAHIFDHRDRTGIAHGEAFPGDTGCE